MEITEKAENRAHSSISFLLVFQKKLESRKKKSDILFVGCEIEEDMILVAIVAELMEEYTALLARVLEHLFHDAPFPRRVRFRILYSLPFASPSSLRFISPPAA